MLLDVLDKVGRTPGFLVYIQYADENEDQDASDLRKSLIDYRLRRKPEQLAKFKLAAVNWKAFIG
jgi:hypothetical protein